MLCKPCYGNRTRREGGEIGLCWQHKKSKCRLCGQLSGGKHYCVNCEHKDDIARWKRESRYPFIHDDDEFVQIQLRKERLWESKYHVHRSVEVFYRALVLAVDAIWGGIKDPKPSDGKPETEKLQSTESEFKEAA